MGKRGGATVGGGQTLAVVAAVRNDFVIFALEVVGRYRWVVEGGGRSGGNAFVAVA